MRKEDLIESECYYINHYNTEYVIKLDTSVGNNEFDLKGSYIDLTDNDLEINVSWGDLTDLANVDDIRLATSIEKNQLLASIKHGAFVEISEIKTNNYPIY
jgi:hypothetical protein